MHYNNKNHLSKQEKELLNKLSEEQLELLEKLEQASQVFNIFSAEMEDMKGSVDTVDEKIKEKESSMNKAIIDAYKTLSTVKYYLDLNFAGQGTPDEIISLSTKVDNSIKSLQENFNTILNENK
jgi:hypothetical protein